MKRQGRHDMRRFESSTTGAVSAMLMRSLLVNLVYGSIQDSIVELEGVSFFPFVHKYSNYSELLWRQDSNSTTFTLEPEMYIRRIWLCRE